MVPLNVVAETWASAAVAAQQQPPEIVEGQAINSGYVILGGRYLSPPYVVGHRGEEVYINGHRIPAESLREERPGGLGYPDPWGPPARRLRRWQHGGAFIMARVERWLINDGLFIGWDDDTADLVDPGCATEVLGILLSGEAKQAKVESLMGIALERISTASWTGLVETFEPAAELRQRIRKHRESMAALQRPAPPAISGSSSLIYGVNVAGLALAVVAFGTLLNHRPKRLACWHEIGGSADGVTLVLRNIVLVVLLSVFDLACTLIAQRSGGFWELNPLGNSLMANPVALVTFKLALLAGSAAILVTFRRRCAAQIASWWLCLLCTILTLRWATYNSIFLT
ncbi:MAG: DUF5658 family protein [Planctomycetota bacterium]|jgi:hypothetical protein